LRVAGIDDGVIGREMVFVFQMEEGNEFVTGVEWERC
jgi:hypothetical protein